MEPMRIYHSLIKKSSIKYEKSIPALLGVSTGVIGTVGAVGMLGGPVGILVGMGISLAFSLIGDHMRKKIVESRANYTLKDLEPMIEDLEIYLKEEITGDLMAKQKEIDESIKAMKSNLENVFKQDVEDLEKQYETTYNEESILEFEKDLKILRELIEEYKEK